MKIAKSSFDVCEARVLMFNRFCAIWPKGYQRESLGKSHQVVEQWTGNSKAAVSNPIERQPFRFACFK